MKIAIFLGGSFGDILNATPIAKKLKELGHNVTWFVSKTYIHALCGNPFIDKKITYEADNKDQCIIKGYNLYKKFKLTNKFDKCAALSPSIIPEWNSNAHISHAICMAANRELGLDIKFKDGWTPILRLSKAEITKANKIKPKTKKTILFECCPESSQSGMCHNLINKMAEHTKNKGWIPIVSVSPGKRKLFADYILTPNLTLREMAHFYRTVEIFVSCSSGLSLAVSSDYNEKIKHPYWLEYVNSKKISTKPIGLHIKKDINIVPINQILENFKQKFNQIIK